MSYSDCRFSQNRGSMPKKIPKRSAVSAVMGRRAFTSSLIRPGGKSMPAAARRTAAQPGGPCSKAFQDHTGQSLRAWFTSPP